MPGPAPQNTCRLCGLPLSGRTVSLKSSGKRHAFCCKGCLTVYGMLLESEEVKRGIAFRETALFKKCRELGIIPRSPEDLKRQDAQKEKEQPAHALFPDSGEPPFLKAENGDSLVLDLKVSGMWCPACAWVIQEALRKAPGVHRAFCHFSTDRLRCLYDPVKTSPSEIRRRIQSLGYAGRPVQDRSRGDADQRAWVKTLVSAFLTANVMMFSVALYGGFFDTFSKETIFKLALPVFLMSAGVLFYGGKEIFQKAFYGIRNTACGMETLIAAGALSAFVLSTYNLFGGSLHLYYDTAAMLITLVLVGKRLESRAKNRVQADLDAFFLSIPNKVRLCTRAHPHGRWVNVRALKRGDRFKVEPGEIVAADGVVIQGAGYVDESALTGEALPVKKTRTERLKSASKVLKGGFTVKAEAVGKDALFGQMLTLMEAALRQKGPHEAQAEKLLRYLVPVIFLFSAGVGIVLLLSGHTMEAAWVRSITVIVITCPCALGVALPLARTAGASRLLRQGILLRDFSALEHVSRIKVYVFDKTGTLTLGRWRLQKTVTEKGFDEKQALSIAAALEAHATHYIAAELLAKAKKMKIPPAKLVNIRRFQNGISGELDGKKVRLGSRRFILGQSKEKVSFSPESSKRLETRDAADSRVYLSMGGRLCATFVFSDPLKQGAKETVSRLKEAGYRVVLVSGDSPRTTQAVARRLGIPEAFGGLLPAEKARWITRLQADAGPSAMVGDGVNDAPAMARADLAVALYSQSPLSKETAHVTLMQNDPCKLLDFMGSANQIRKKMHQNLAWAFVYNILAVPIAAAGLLNPIIAVSLMLVSSLSVIGNTLLLLGNTQRREPDRSGAG